MAFLRREKSRLDDNSSNLNFDEWSQSSIEQHDLYNFEVKLDYVLEKSIPKNVYELNTYIFIPNALQINKMTYSKDDFFADRNYYLRFKTARMSLSGLLNEENDLSPFNMIKTRVEKIKDGNFDTQIIKKISYELRVMGCIVKSNLRDQIDFFLKNSKDLKKNSEYFTIFTSYIEDIKNLQTLMRSLKHEFQLVQIPAELKETFIFVDEYISNQIEEYLTLLLSSLKIEDDICAKIAGMVEFEQKHRQNMKSKILIEKESDNKSYIYWKSILKKFVQGVLYLDIFPRDEKSKALEFLYSLAAGLAMFFSVLLGFLIISQFENQQWAYIIALVVVYMLKDRIKENIRILFNVFVEKYYPDRSFEIIDKNNKTKIGLGKEIVQFVKWGDVPNTILQIRESTNKSAIEREGKPEIVLKYSKIIELQTEKISEYHKRHSNINDIIRFNVKNFLQYADDPISVENLWDPKKKHIIKVPCAKVYHLNIIFRMKMPNKQIHYKKIRVILNQKGILEVLEPVFSIS